MTAPAGPPSDRSEPGCPRPSASDVYLRRHLRFGWCALLIAVTFGLILESLHGAKVGWYLDVSHQTRRLMLTLAHAHGTLLALVNLAFGCTTVLLPERRVRWRALASGCLLMASVMLPLGFFLGGIWTYGGDPGLGILLVPIGGVLLVVAILCVIP